MFESIKRTHSISPPSTTFFVDNLRYKTEVETAMIILFQIGCKFDYHYNIRQCILYELKPKYLMTHRYILKCIPTQIKMKYYKYTCTMSFDSDNQMINSETERLTFSFYIILL